MTDKRDMGEVGDGMDGVRQCTEVALRIPNDLNLLAKLFAALAIVREGILGWCFYSNHEQASALLVTVNGNKTAHALRALGFRCETNPVVVVAQKDHSLSAVMVKAELRAAEIHILDTYTCCSRQNGTALVLKTADCSRTVEVLKAMNLLHATEPSEVKSDSVVTLGQMG